MPLFKICRRHGRIRHFESQVLRSTSFLGSNCSLCLAIRSVLHCCSISNCSVACSEIVLAWHSQLESINTIYLSPKDKQPSCVCARACVYGEPLMLLPFSRDLSRNIKQSSVTLMWELLRCPPQLRTIGI